MQNKDFVQNFENQGFLFLGFFCPDFFFIVIFIKFIFFVQDHEIQKLPPVVIHHRCFQTPRVLVNLPDNNYSFS